MTVKELKKKDGYSFECNIDGRSVNAEKKRCGVYDEWASAFAGFEDISTEYNICISNSGNYSAIYKVIFNKEDYCIETDYDEFVHYEVDFSNRRWKRDLENAMCEALIKFFF